MKRTLVLFTRTFLNVRIKRLVTAALLWMLAITVPYAGMAASRKHEVTGTDSVLKKLSYQDAQRFTYYFLEAANQQSLGNLDAAFDLLRHCLNIDPRSAVVHYQLSQYYARLGNDSLALRYMQYAASHEPANDDYQEMLARYYMGMNKVDDATRAYEALYSHNHERTDVLEVLAGLYEQQKKYDKVLYTIHRIEQAEGTSEELTLSKMRIYELMNNKKAAYQSLEQLAAQHPSDLNYQVMKGNWLLQNGKPKQAYAIFSKAMAEEPDNVYVLSSMYDYYNSLGNDEMASKLMRELLINRNTATDTKVQLIRNAIAQNESDGKADSVAMLNLFDSVIKANPEDADMASLKIAYMQLKKMPDSLRMAAMRQALKNVPDNSDVRLQLIQLLWQQKDWKDIVAESKAGTEYTPDEMAYYYFLGLAYYQLDDHDHALDAFQRGVAEINSSSKPELVSDFYALMGDLYHLKGDERDAFNAYDSCLQWKPDHAVCLNNYAYYLSESNKELAKAEQMSYKAITAEPANSTYLDTYAWIMFKEKRYAEAKIYIDKALKCDTDSVQSGAVLEHAGDIYMMNNEPGAALSYWQKALQAGGTSPLLPKKIKLRKYISDEK